MATDLVSVIIPTHNRGESLFRTIESVARQRYGHFEIIVVDDGSTEPVAGELEGFATVRVIRTRERRGPSYARNLGILQATGEYVWFLDSDVLMPDEGTLERLVGAFSSGDAIGSLGGEIVAHEPSRENAYGRRICWNGRNRRVVSHVRDPSWIECDYLATCNCFTRRDHLLRIGGFDEQFVFGAEDQDLGYRLKALGLKNYVSHAFAVIHCQEKSGRYENETERYQKTRMQFAGVHFGTLHLWALYASELCGFVAFYLLLVPKLLYKIARRQRVTRQNYLGGWHRLKSVFATPHQGAVSMLKSKSDVGRVG